MNKSITKLNGERTFQSALTFFLFHTTIYFTLKSMTRVKSRIVGACQCLPTKCAETSQVSLGEFLLFPQSGYSELK